MLTHSWSMNLMLEARLAVVAHTLAKTQSNREPDLQLTPRELTEAASCSNKRSFRSRERRKLMPSVSVSASDSMKRLITASTPV